MNLIVTYLICGMLMEFYFMYNLLAKHSEMDFTVMDLFIAVSIITIWPLALIMETFKGKFNFKTVLFKIKL